LIESTDNEIISVQKIGQASEVHKPKTCADSLAQEASDLIEGCTGVGWWLGASDSRRVDAHESDSGGNGSVEFGWDLEVLSTACLCGVAWTSFIAAGSGDTNSGGVLL
jgi:hypothetical protein